MSIFSTCNHYSDNTSICESAINASENIETLEEGVLKYTPSMIPVLAKNTAEGTKYIVEFDMLKRIYDDMTICEAFDAICEANNIDPEDTYVVTKNTYDSISESCDAILGSDSYDDICMYEAQMNIDALSIKSLIESGVNVLFMESTADAKAGAKAFFKALKLEFGEKFSSSNFPRFKSKMEKFIKESQYYDEYVVILKELKHFRYKYDEGATTNGSGIIKWFDEKINFVSDKINETREQTSKYQKQQAKVDRAEEKAAKKAEAKEAKRAAKEAKRAEKEAAKEAKRAARENSEE